ncbi:exosortase E/protease, VPEID-CTERM system [Sulfitobacter aestuarii]|uniref:Exosortase E/protease, VPEID-CTERM system n=1 Tax=Sulfitobacter aestuarii TaxID=2161676 RepID=A0ABW5TZJ0_9RHOB
MTFKDLDLPRTPVRFARPLLALLIAAATLTLMGHAFDAIYKPECGKFTIWRMCLFLVTLEKRLLALLVILLLAMMARPGRFTALGRAAMTPAATGPQFMLILPGVFLVLLSSLFFEATDPAGLRQIGLTAWITGGLLVAAGALRLIAPWSVWGGTLRENWLSLALPALIALSLPEIGRFLFPLWHIEAVRQLSFDAVVALAPLTGLDLFHIPGEYVIGQGDFLVRINQSCSGVEGFALISVFLTLYITLFRRELAFPRIFLILPIGLALSWVFNVIRITLLIWIGVNISPDLAVDGFHSHAGWLMFSVLALGCALSLRLVPWFQRAHVGRSASAAAISAPRPLPPLLQDWNAVRILPFAVFMASAVIASTFFTLPSLAYPMRFLLMLAVLFLFRRALARIDWRLSPLAAGLGAVIGLLWLWSAPVAQADTPLDLALASLGPLALAIWIVARVGGTILAVPLIEELFFRSYLLERLGAGRSPWFMLLAVALSTAAFALLHDRWLAAALAGLVFAWLALRRDGRLSDAVLCHVIANAVIAGQALILGNWALI